MKLVDQSNPYILQQKWEWTFLKIHNLLNKNDQRKKIYRPPLKDAEAKGGCLVKETEKK